MTILEAVRDRLSGSPTAAKPTPATAETSPDVNADPPIDGYDGLDDRQVMKQLADHTQVELEAIEGYERSHEDRQSVLDKLRYMRGREPLPSYDELDSSEIVAALEDADLPAIRRVRGYERKFGNRPDVLEAVADVHHKRLAAEPAAEAPGYEPMSAK